MSTLLSRFREPLPPWIGDIKTEVRRVVEHSSLIQRCAEGNSAHVHYLLRGYWPLIKEVPVILNGTQLFIQARMKKSDLVARFGIGAVPDFMRILEIIDTDIVSDERAYPRLWQEAAFTIGISQNELASDRPIPEIKSLTAHVRDNASLWVQMLRFAAVEMIAEAISRILLGSYRFRVRVGDSGTAWFRRHYWEHELHEDMTHEEIEIRLSRVLHLIEKGEGDIPEEEARRTIQETAERFARAGEALSRQAEERLRG